jgi:hypothetical protein
LSDIAPDRFIDNVFAYQKTAAVKAAVEIDLFSAIGAGADSVETLAAKVHASARGVRILCDYPTVQELLIKDGKRYRLTPSAAGHGVFGIAIGKAVPGARIVALDWRPVLEVALENARLAGLETRYDTIAGSAFDVEWGSDYDLVLIPNFLHHFDREGCVSILGRARRALAPGGAALVVEMVPNDDQVRPPFPAAFAFVMLATTPKGDAWTARELQEMGRSAGFGDSVVQPLPPSPQTMIVFR